MTPQILITQNGGVEIVVSYDPVQTAFGDIQGNVGSTDNAIVRTNGASGEVVQGSLATIEDNGDILTSGDVQAENLIAQTSVSCDTVYTNSVVLPVGYMAITSNANGDPTKFHATQSETR